MFSRHKVAVGGKKYRKIAEAHSEDGARNIQRAFLDMGYPSVKIRYTPHNNRWSVYIVLDAKYR